MAILGSNIPIASFYFRSTVGFPKCCSKDAYPRFGNFDSTDSTIPMPGPVQDLNITSDLIDVMKMITDVHMRQLSRISKIFLLVVALIFGCAISIGLMIFNNLMTLSSSSTPDHKDLDLPIFLFVLGFVGCMMGTCVSMCCCICVGCDTSRNLKRIVGDFNRRCE